MSGLSMKVYGSILLLYPPDLQRDFGTDMIELFGEDLDDAWRRRRFAGVFRVWWCAVCEFWRIAWPAQRKSPAFLVPAIAAAFNALSLSATFAGELSHHTVIPSGMLGDGLAEIVCACTVTALTTSVVVRTGKVHVVSLELNSAGDGTPCSKSAI
jgi:hypothetical protein